MVSKVRNGISGTMERSSIKGHYYGRRLKVDFNEEFKFGGGR